MHAHACPRAHAHQLQREFVIQQVALTGSSRVATPVVLANPVLTLLTTASSVGSYQRVSSR